MSASGERFVETISRIYEAAAIPELWPEVLDHISDLTACMGGILLAADADNSVRYVASDSLQPLMGAFQSGGWMDRNTRAARLAAREHQGFVLDSDLYTRAEMDSDPLYLEVLRRHGGGWAVGTMVPVPSGDTLIFNIERPYANGPVPRAAVAKLDLLRPHLARAALISARLRLEQARNTAEVLGRIGIPAAVLDGSGRAIAINGLMEMLEQAFAFSARNRVQLRNAAADVLFEQALVHTDDAGVHEEVVRSIPVPARLDHPAFIVHLTPVEGAAHDVFSRAQFVMVVTLITASRQPSAGILTGLFDLTAAEARLAAQVGTGLSPREAAEKLNITEESARTVLKRVFSKVGVSRQSELAALLAKLVVR